MIDDSSVRIELYPSAVLNSKFSIHDSTLNSKKEIMNEEERILNNEVLSFNAQWSGANNPLWIISQLNEEESSSAHQHISTSTHPLHEVKPDKMPIGLSDSFEKSFTLNEFELEKNDIVYLFSDGYSDQFGGPNGRKLMSRNFKNTLSANSNKSMLEQKTEILSELNKWMNPENLESYEQIDDITILGIKI